MLLDGCGRRIDYLRLSVTDRCNLQCIYCSPEEVEWTRRGEILSYEEMLCLLDVASSLGFRRARLTGGEPLLRRDFVHFLERIVSPSRSLQVCLTTNGLLLAPLARSLYQAGLRHVNVSLDSLKREKYSRICGVDGLSRVLRGLDAALEAGFDTVKVNVVLVKGLNEDEIDGFARLAESRPLTVRFIEFMPTGVSRWDSSKLVPGKSVLERLTGEHRLLRKIPRDGGGPSVEYSFSGFVGKVGFISSVTEPSCSLCNRLRVTAQGRLRACLFSDREFELKTALRSKEPREAVKKAIREAVRSKPRGYILRDPERKSRTPMAQIGG